MRGLRDYKWESLAIFLVSCTPFAGNIIYPYFLKLSVDALVGFRAAGTINWTTIGWLATMGAAWWTMFYIPATSAEMLMARPLAEMRTGICQRLVMYIYRHAPRFYHDRFAGGVGNYIRDLSESLYEIFNDTLTQLLPGIIYLVFLAFAYIKLDIGFFVIFIVWLVLQVGVLVATHKTSKRKSAANSEAFSSLFGNIIDSLSNHSSVRAFAAQDYERDLLNSVEKRLIKARKANIYFTRGVTLAMGWVQPFIVFGGFFGWYMYLFQKGMATPGDLVFLMPNVGGMMNNVRMLTTRLLAIYEQAGIGQNAIDKLLVPHDIIDLENATDLHISNGEIVVDHVTFAYEQGRNILQDVSFTVKAGEKIGMVGYSGAGKSTLVHLLMRLYDTQQGTIKIDGQDIKEVTQDSLRRNIAFIPQDISLFHRSLLDNIQIANVDATKEEIVLAATRAGAHEFIATLPNGYDTLVGERGVKLSGGQRQRIAIARAFLQKASILILDEATSALDSITEHTIQHALEDVMSNRTTIVIAHRLSTLRQMNRILVMENGSIVEQGTHDELLGLNGRYAKMWAMQAGGFLPDQLEV